MFVFDICPPQGPWPTPPWCEGNSFSNYSWHPEKNDLNNPADFENEVLVEKGKVTTEEKDFQEVSQEKNAGISGETTSTVTKKEIVEKPEEKIIPTIYKKDFQKGVTFGAMKWDTYAKQHVKESMADAINLGVNTIVIIPDWFVFPDQYGVEIKPFYESDGVFPNATGWITPTLTDNELTSIVRLAKKNNLNVVLKPHVDPIDFGITPKSNRVELHPKNWDTWFSNYEKFILHYADFAEKEGADALVVGTELDTTIWQMPNSAEKWNNLICKIRKIYKGKLTYSVGCYNGGCQGPSEVGFWSSLDYIGFEPYFGLSNKNNPTVEEMAQSFGSKLDSYAGVLSKKYNKPVVLSEVNVYGYDGVNKDPIGATPANAVKDHQEQADYYDALFRTIKNRDWIQGVYLWGWYIGTTSEKDKPSQLNDFGDSFAQKKAGEVVKEWFQKIYIKK